jgi:hypothetical protein
MAPPSGTVPRLDELIRPFLLEGRSEWHNLLLLATLAVVAGVALEGWEIFRDLREETDHNRQTTPRKLPLELSGEGIPIFNHRHRRRWIKTRGAIGWTLVVFGVAGELAFDSMDADFDTSIRSIDDELLGQARLVAANANERAATAIERAAENDVKAEQLRKDNLILRAAIQPREYTPAEQDRIVAACRRFSGRLVDFRSQVFDLEGATFAYQIGDILRRAGIFSRTYDVGLNTPPLEGRVISDLHICGPPNEQDLVRALSESLATQHVLIAPPAPLVVANCSSTTVFVGAKRISR